MTGFEFPPGTIHLRAGGRPEAERSGADVLVWTECGEQVLSTFIDNDEAGATCTFCLYYERLARHHPRHLPVDT